METVAKFWSRWGYWAGLGSVFCSSVLSVPVGAAVSDLTGSQYLSEAAELYKSGQYFKSSRYAFAALERDPSLRPGAYAWITLGLTHAGLPHAASYFFIRALQSRDSAAIRSVLSQTQQLTVHVGTDLFRHYLIKYTQYEQYDDLNRSAYLYALGKDALISGDAKKAVGYFSGMHSSSPLWPNALQMRATAYAILGRNQEALHDFRKCQSAAEEDLSARCTASEARTLYQMDQFQEADRVYDSIAKGTWVWPDILFEQAWNSFALQEYNRTLGKLVSYKSPALDFIFNPEVAVLQAQSYLALCQYSDANDVINEFNQAYDVVGNEIKSFVEQNANNLDEFYRFGRSVLSASLHSRNGVNRMVNRFIRGPYFQNLVQSEGQLRRELEMIRRFDSGQTGVDHDLAKGFPGFLEQVIHWRERSIRFLGGAFVKNSLMDYHATLIDDSEKMSFIKLEMLKRAKDQLIYKNRPVGERVRGNVNPTPRGDQIQWDFNGEFWNDELGDYVFGLESECRG